MGLTREKLGKKRKIRRPQSLVIPAAPKARKAKPQPAASPEVEEALEQLRMEELMEQPEDEISGKASSQGEGYHGIDNREFL